MTGTPTAQDCEHAQTAWFETRARLLDGETWDDHGLVWALEPGHASLLFPREIDPEALARGLARIGPQVGVGAWLPLDTDPRPLADAGFECGWSPWWMTAPIAEVGSSHDPRVELKEETTDYGGEYAEYARNLALTRDRPKHTWYAAAYDGAERSFAGQAWSHLGSEEIAGIFDMAVWEPFRRRGLGTALLQAVCSGAAGAGARHAVLNATPEGKELYVTCGFTQIGEGITWWRHPRAG